MAIIRPAEPPTVKAIETVYKGNRFRSRLEARWAVFMDALSVKFVYEPEGYEFERARYLPDFYLPEFDCFIEIKPNEDSFDGKACYKAEQLAETTGKTVYVFVGECAPPKFTDDGRENTAYAYGLTKWREPERFASYAAMAFVACHFCDRIGFSMAGCMPLCNCKQINFLLDQSVSPRILAAFAVARSVRFERYTPSAEEVEEAFDLVLTTGINECMRNSKAFGFFMNEAAEQMNRLQGYAE